MDLAGIDDRRTLVPSIPNRIRNLLSAARLKIRPRPIGRPRWPTVDARKRRMAAGALLLAGSAVTGLWAYDQSVADGLSQWKRTHFPSRGAWIHALGELGYQNVSDPGALAKALRNLPSQIDSEGSVWSSPDSSWIAVYDTGEHGLLLQGYCLTCSKPTRAWEPLGTGWDGFDSALERGRRAAEKLRPLAHPRKEEPIDPREIRY